MHIYKYAIFYFAFYLFIFYWIVLVVLMACGSSWARDWIHATAVASCCATWELPVFCFLKNEYFGETFPISVFLIFLINGCTLHSSISYTWKNSIIFLYYTVFYNVDLGASNFFLWDSLSLWPHLQHAEVPRPGIELEPQQWQQVTAVTMLNP